MPYTNLKLKETGLMNRDIHYLTAKLEEIHDDVKELRAHVDILRQEAAGKRAVSKALVVALGLIGATVGWLVDNAVTVAQHIKFG